MKAVSLALILLLLVVFVQAASQFPEQEYGYVNINTDGSTAMFYALYGNADANTRRTAPLVMYLQGGPGASSLFGALLENGPYKLSTANGQLGYKVTNRTHTWTRHATMLYVDNPVGTGLSYVKSGGKFSTTDRGIADNMVVFLQGFLQKHPEFVTTKFWVFCESYGGKMTAYFGAALAKAIEAKTIQANFQGVALGDGWVSPVDCMYSYGKYLYGFSNVNKREVEKITQYANWAQDALEEGNGTLATHYWGAQQSIIGSDTGGINWYNSLYYYDYTADNVLGPYVRQVLQKQLGSLIPSGVEYDAQAMEVFEKMSGSFMDDGINQVLEMLQKNYTVNVYCGQLDLIVDCVCTQNWIAKLNWPGLSSFNKAPRTPIFPPGDKNVEGFKQEYENFHFWQIMKAGHMVPLDNPVMAELMMATIVGGDTKAVPPQDPTELKLNAGNKKRAIHRRRHLYKP